MELIVNGTKVSDKADNDKIESSIYSLTAEGDSFVILAKAELYYIQTAGDPSSGFVLEYQAGSLERHFSCAEVIVDASTVVRAFQSYLAEDGAWKSVCSWEKVDLGLSSGGGGAIAPLFIVMLSIAVFFVWKFRRAT